MTFYTGSWEIKDTTSLDGEASARYMYIDYTCLSSIYLAFYLSIYPYIYLSIYLSTYLSVVMILIGDMT